MSNHSPDYDTEMERRIDLLEGKLKQAAKTEGLGPTGRFPEGKLTAQDEGETKIGVTSVDGKVVMNFGKPMTWIGFTPELARQLADSLLRHANEIDPR